MNVAQQEWIGELPSGWDTVSLRDVLIERKELNKLRQETNILSVTNDRGVINYRDKGNVGNKASDDIERYKRVYRGDIVANSMNVIIGSVGISPEDGVLSPVYIVMKPADDVDTRFYDYIFKARGFQAQLKRIGYGILDHRMRIPWDNLKIQQLPKPDYKTQQKIADFLDTETAQIDNLIAKQERLLELLEEKRRATITHAVTRGLNPGVELKETNIPWLAQIPARHSVKKLKVVLRLNTGGTWGGEPVGDESDTVVLRSTEQTVDGAWVLDSPATRKISKSEYDKTKLTVGDLVVTKSSGSELHIGKTSIVDESTAGFSYSNFMQRLRLKQKENPKFYWYLLNSNLAREQYNYYSNSTSGLANLNSTIFDELQFVHFDSSEQGRVVHRLDEEEAKFGELKQKIQTQITLLRERRTSLISHAVTGKIKV